MKDSIALIILVMLLVGGCVGDKYIDYIFEEKIATLEVEKQRLKTESNKYYYDSMERVNNTILEIKGLR